MEIRKIKWKIMSNSWDLGEHESWFSDMAKEGLHLRKVGGWFFAHFEQGEPKDTQYRIDTSPNKKISEADKEMFQEAGWQHVTKLGEFNVFSSPTELQAPELHTDPVEQAYTLEDLAKRIQRSTIHTIIFCVIGIAISSFFWKTPALTLVIGELSLIVVLLSLASSLLTGLQSNLSIRRLRKRLLEGKAINHHAQWKKKGRLARAISSILITLLIVNLVMLVVQITLRETATLPVESGDLPIVRLADIVQNPQLVREEEFVAEQLDGLNQYRYNWSPIAPLQYESDEQGIVPGQLWQDEDATYSPSLHTQVYRLTFPSLSDKLMADLVRRYIYEGEVIEQESDVFDSLFIYETEGSKKVFAAKGKGVIYVAYYGYADMATILSIIGEKVALVEN